MMSVPRRPALAGLGEISVTAARAKIVIRPRIAFPSGKLAVVRFFFPLMLVTPKCRGKPSCADAARCFAQPLAQCRDFFSNRADVASVTEAIEIDLHIRQSSLGPRGRQQPRHF